MPKKLLVTLSKASDLEAVRKSGAQILAEYPNAALVSCTDEHEQALRAANLKTATLETPTIQLSGATFELSAALRAEEASPIVPPEPGRKAYYLAQLVGPAKGEWLDEITALGAAIHDNAASYTLILGIEPAQVNKLRDMRFVETVTPYRPAMKVAPELRRLDTRVLGMNELASAAPAAAEAAPQGGQQVQVSVFPGESTSAVVAAVKAAGGSIVAETAETVTAMVPDNAIASLAERQGVQSIVPHRFPELLNDRALPILEIPGDGIVGEIGALRGSGQIVAVADSGLDSGDLQNMHPDFVGRIAGLFSFPAEAGLKPLCKNPLPIDDGPSDQGRGQGAGHGTHVAGSVLGSGAAARATGLNLVPQGAVWGLNVMRAAPGAPPGARRQTYALVASNAASLVFGN
jgi:serine protease AprX